MSTFSVFCFNRSTKENGLCINGLSQTEAATFAEKMRAIYPACEGQDWQGFDITVEEEPAPTLPPVEEADRLLIELKYVWAMADTYSAKIDAEPNMTGNRYEFLVGQVHKYRLQAEGIRGQLLAIVAAGS